jgi:hypothetical protein
VASTALVRSQHVLIREVEEAVLLRAAGDGAEVIALSGSGPEIWSLFRTPSTPESLVTELADRFNVAADVIRSDVLATVQTLVEAGVLTRAHA